MKEENEVAQLDIKDLLAIGMILVVLIIGIAYGQNVTADVKDDFGIDACAARTDSMTSYNTTSGYCYNASGTVIVGTSEYNSTVDGMTSLSKITAKLPTLITVVMAAVIIGVLIRYLYVSYNN